MADDYRTTRLHVATDRKLCPMKKSKLAELLTDAELTQFLRGEALIDHASPPPEDPTDVKLQRFRTSDDNRQILNALHEFVHAVIPKPKGTFAAGLWSISCLPSTNSSSRLFTLNVPGVELCFAGEVKDEDGQWIWVDINLDSETLSQKARKRLVTFANVEDLNYKRPATSASMDIACLPEISRDPEFLLAARTYVVACMQRGGTTWKSTASPALAAAILAPQASFETASLYPRLDRNQISRTAATKGFQTTAKMRKAIEERGMDLAEKHLQDRGYKTHRVHLENRGYDMSAERNGRIIHVEIKGTTGPGEKVSITRNELDHATKEDESVLIVVSDIRLNDGVATGGIVRVWDPWNPSEESLEVVTYQHRLDDAKATGLR
jgi:hypothetical protein